MNNHTPNSPRSNWFKEWSTAVLEREEAAGHGSSGPGNLTVTGSSSMGATRTRRVQATPSTARPPVNSPLIPGWVAMLPVFCTAAWLLVLLTALAVL